MKDFSALVDNKAFVGQPVKNKQKACEKKLIAMSRNNDYATGNLLYQTYWTIQMILYSWQENGALSMINQIPVTMYVMKLSIIQTF